MSLDNEAQREAPLVSLESWAALEVVTAFRKAFDASLWFRALSKSVMDV